MNYEIVKNAQEFKTFGTLTSQTIQQIMITVFLDASLPNLENA
jgi:hypothetical protein